MSAGGTTPPVVAARATTSGRPWVWRQVDENRALALAQRYGLPEILGRLLVARGVDGDGVERHLEPRLRDWLPDPSHLLDLDRAVVRLAEAIEGREPVAMITDYDVDGATSAALMASVLEELGVAVEVLVPDRLQHGYGPHPELFDRLAGAGFRLVLVLDAGTTAFAALEHARARGLEVIVVDHHSCDDRLPPAFAFINPNRPGQESPVRHLAAVGITFLLLVGLLRYLRGRGRDPLPDLFAQLDLVALGTVCDVVPLEGLNRAFVRQGLRIAERGQRTGLSALARAARMNRIDDTWHLAFALGPRLNAAGRLGRSDLAVALLCEQDPARAAALAAELDRLNRERQEREQQVLAEAERQVEPQLREGVPLLFACGAGWHPGVVGIVAGRLVERYGLPAIVLGLEQGSAKGSARSLPGLDIGRVILAARARRLAREGGGHPLAAGVTVDSSHLEAFRRFLLDEAKMAQERSGGWSVPLVLDGGLSPGGIDPALAALIARLGPFGAGNPEPRFAVLDAMPLQARVVGRDHVACLLAGPDGRRVRGIAFRAAGTPLGRRLLTGGTRLWFAGRLQHEEWQGEMRASLRIEDVATP